MSAPAMRAAPTWIVTFAMAAYAVPATVVQAQADMVPYEEEMEAEGMPPTTMPPPSAAIIGPDDPIVGAHKPLSANAALMDRLMIEATEKTLRQQKFAAAAGITGGGILLGLGVWRLVEDPPDTPYSRGLGVMFMTLGAADLTTGIFAATRISHERRRLERWKKAKVDGISELELARAEGELLASAETREGERLLVRWNGLAHALAGVVVLTLTPLPDASGRDRISGWVIGSLFIGTGMVAFGMSYKPTPSEAAWKAYQAGKVSNQAVSWRMSPTISRHGFGLGMSGTF